ncbi:MAG: hypothetical protein OXI13_06345 [Gammaproteobacteria bacterium]|nr:hypothetical protein [Gammaproteobacteria bacterium]
MTNGRASQIMGMASARIEKYAPDAPLVMKREAAERFVFYLSEAPSGAIVSRSRKGMLPTADGGGHLTDLSATSQYSHAAMFKKCGAERTLRDWRVFRAAHIEKDDD